MLKPQPTWKVGTVLELSPEWLLAQGVKGLLLDLDETLTPAHEAQVPQAFAAWVAQAQAAGLRLGVVSNNSRLVRVRDASEPLGLPWIFKAMKPFGAGFRTMLGRLGLKAEEVAVVGDQLYTDVLGGNRLGAKTILVHPLAPEHKAWRKRMRRVEAWALGDPNWPALAKA